MYIISNKNKQFVLIRVWGVEPCCILGDEGWGLGGDALVQLHATHVHTSSQFGGFVSFTLGVITCCVLPDC